MPRPDCPPSLTLRLTRTFSDPADAAHPATPGTVPRSLRLPFPPKLMRPRPGKRCIWVSVHIHRAPFPIKLGLRLKFRPGPAPRLLKSLHIVLDILQDHLISCGPQLVPTRGWISASLEIAGNCDKPSGFSSRSLPPRVGKSAPKSSSQPCTALGSEKNAGWMPRSLCPQHLMHMCQRRSLSQLPGGGLLPRVSLVSSPVLPRERPSAGKGPR